MKIKLPLDKTGHEAGMGIPPKSMGKKGPNAKLGMAHVSRTPLTPMGHQAHKVSAIPKGR